MAIKELGWLICASHFPRNRHCVPKSETDQPIVRNPSWTPRPRRPLVTRTGRDDRVLTTWGRSGDYAVDRNAAGITLIKVKAGDQPDKVTNSTALKSSLDGGSADDTLLGGSAKDTLIGRDGADVLKG